MEPIEIQELAFGLIGSRCSCLLFKDSIYIVLHHGEGLIIHVAGDMYLLWFPTAEASTDVCDFARIFDPTNDMDPARDCCAA